MIIDFHTHTFPEKIAEKALATLSNNVGDVEPMIFSIPDNLSEYLKKNDVDYSVVLNIATNPKQQKSVNDFAIELNQGRFISFGSVHPDAEDALEELDRISEAGLKGIKLHPDYQNFFVDDEKVFPIYEKAAKLGLITVFHAGVDLGLFEPVHCTPERMAKALPAFNGGKVVAAHWGGFMMWYGVEQHLVGKDIYFDTAYAYGHMPKEQAMRIVKNHGAGKILFGSDMPWSGSREEMRFIKSFNLSAENEAKIFGINAQKLLNL
ncbi:MAG: amidohydrolase family protein [Bacillota bacterium]|nr:amidohydrolase family protein [Bacillota bacterium]